MRAASVTLVAVLFSFSAQSQAAGVEFDAAIGKTGYGRCHMDSCGFFIIDSAVPVGSNKDGTLFIISSRDWGAEYKVHGDNDEHEYDRPPVSVSKPVSSISMVYCSKTKPVTFDYYETEMAIERPSPRR
jgi:hypothetical protein